MIAAQNQVFGDSWPGVVKSLQITFRQHEKPTSVVVYEGTSIIIPEGQEILGCDLSCTLENGPFKIIDGV